MVSGRCGLFCFACGIDPECYDARHCSIHVFKCKYGAAHGTETELKCCNRVRQNLIQLKIADLMTNTLAGQQTDYIY